MEVLKLGIPKGSLEEATIELFGILYLTFLQAPSRVLLQLYNVGLVRVLDTQHEGAAVLVRVQIVEKRGARAADMQIARGAGRKAGHYFGHAEGSVEVMLGLMRKAPECRTVNPAEFPQIFMDAG